MPFAKKIKLAAYFSNVNVNRSDFHLHFGKPSWENTHKQTGMVSIFIIETYVTHFGSKMLNTDVLKSAKELKFVPD